MGDFNYPTTNYLDGNVESGPNSAAAKFYNTTQDLVLFQHVTEPTKVRQDQIPSTLDLIFTDKDNVIEEPLGKSDHAVLERNLLLGTAIKHSHEKKFVYYKGDYDSESN